jgi:hypothetical protein
MAPNTFTLKFVGEYKQDKAQTLDIKGFELYLKDDL